ncbi:MAG: cobalamin biosynthesis protein CobD [Alphaproteobacteria bacterium]|nr:cobalamin biosynthesis protein CobD [Alphaproteobacteria bacterium]
MFSAAALAMVIERLVGYPDVILQKIGHPVMWIGSLISWADTSLNRPGLPPFQARMRGMLGLALVILAAGLPAWMIATVLDGWARGWIVEAFLATSLMAQKSLRDHVKAVDSALALSLAEGRRMVARIVGRDPDRLDESGIARAALESLAENASDGIVAPVLWYALLGLPGIAVYKAINTADSMIGHRSDRHLHFGWAAARLDDIVNLPFSRLTGLLFALSAGWWNTGRVKDVIAIMRRDAPRHQSPNAGWPESALAAALGVVLGGPRAYGGQVIDLATMGEGRRHLTRKDIRAGLRLYDRVLLQLLALLVIGAIVTSS